MAKTSKEPIINILSDSRSSLDLLKQPKLGHPLVRSVRENIGMIRAEKREIRLLWLRAHVGTAGNERADELAKTAALGQGNLDYNKVPLSYIKKTIRKESVLKWQDRYVTSDTGKVTRTFLPDVEKAYRLVRKIHLTPYQVQALTGHGGIAEYLHRFHLRDTPGCECDPGVRETVEHIITECPRFLIHRENLEARIDAHLVMSEMKKFMDDPTIRQPLLDFLHKIFKRVSARNSTLTEQNNQTTVDAITAPTSPTPNIIEPPFNNLTTQQFLGIAEKGSSGIRVRGVAFFMDDNTEKLGISFCIVGARKFIALSPGLGYLLNGSTRKTSMKRKQYLALPETGLAGHSCRLVRARNKTVALFEWGTKSPFVQVNTLLSGLEKRDTIQGEHPTIPRRISIDAMVVEYERGTVLDRLGCLLASKHHEVIVYEDRGEDLSYLISSTKDAEPTPSASTTNSGSEKLQKKIAESRDKTKPTTSSPKERASQGGLLKKLITTLKSPTQQNQQRKDQLPGTSVERFFQPNYITQYLKSKTKTRADKGEVIPPIPIPASGPREHSLNAFLEYLAAIKGDKQVYTTICKKILQAYKYKNLKLLDVLLEEADAAIYDNANSKVIRGNLTGTYMAAYSATGGFVTLDREQPQTDKPHFNTPPEDHIVVTAGCTRIMLDEKILTMAKTITGDKDVKAVLDTWKVPSFRWVNGVPGCGKSTWIIKNFNENTDVIATTTVEPAKELKEKLSLRIGKTAYTKVRTVASILANGFKESGKCSRLIVDEALMNHFGAVVMAAQLSGADEVVLIGDVNQLPYIDRNNLFPMYYTRPQLITNITQELLCTYRNPLDVAYALSEVYKGIYSANTKVKSLRLERYTDATIPADQHNTLFLTHTQQEKETLQEQGYGKGEGSRILTIHESQGLTFKTVLIIQTKRRRLKLHDSVSHAVVALSRHTEKCVYYSDDNGDAIGQFTRRAEETTPSNIVDYNLKMAIKHRDYSLIEKLKNINT